MFLGAVSSVRPDVACPSTTSTLPLRQVQITSPAQTKMKRAMVSSKLSVPNLLARVLETKPAKIDPAMAPPPTIPNTRLASRVVRT